MSSMGAEAYGNFGIFTYIVTARRRIAWVGSGVRLVRPGPAARCVRAALLRTGFAWRFFTGLFIAFSLYTFTADAACSHFFTPCIRLCRMFLKAAWPDSYSLLFFARCFAASCP